MEIELRVARAEIQRLRGVLFQIREISARDDAGGIYGAMATEGLGDGEEEAGPSAETGAPI